MAKKDAEMAELRQDMAELRRVKDVEIAELRAAKESAERKVNHVIPVLARAPAAASGAMASQLGMQVNLSEEIETMVRPKYQISATRNLHIVDQRHPQHSLRPPTRYATPISSTGLPWSSPSPPNGTRAMRRRRNRVRSSRA